MRKSVYLIRIEIKYYRNEKWKNLWRQSTTKNGGNVVKNMSILLQFSFHVRWTKSISISPHRFLLHSSLSMSTFTRNLFLLPTYQTHFIVKWKSVFKHSIQKCWNSRCQEDHHTSDLYWFNSGWPLPPLNNYCTIFKLRH